MYNQPMLHQVGQPMLHQVGVLPSPPPQRKTHLRPLSNRKNLQSFHHLHRSSDGQFDIHKSHNFVRAALIACPRLTCQQVCVNQHDS